MSFRERVFIAVLPVLLKDALVKGKVWPKILVKLAFDIADQAALHNAIENDNLSTIKKNCKEAGFRQHRWINGVCSRCGQSPTNTKEYKAAYISDWRRKENIKRLA